VAISVLMPKLGMSMTEGTVAEWRVEQGQPVRKGQVIVDIESEKIVYEIEAPVDGVLLKILVEAEQVCPVGQPIALIGAEGEQPVVPLASPAAESPVSLEQSVASTKPPKIGPGSQPGRGREVRSSPSARRLARELGIDLAGVIGTGPDGRIVKEDVLQAPGKQPLDAEEKSPGRLVPLTALRKTIASRMQDSAQTIPHVTLHVTADARGLIRARAAHRAAVSSAGVKITYANWTNDLLIFLVSRALAENGTLNSSFEEGAIRYYDHVHMGLAVALEQGVVVPVIRNADRLTLIEIAQKRSELMAKARARKLKGSDVSGGTFTITNLGMYPIDSFDPIINPPQAAILSVGRFRQEPAVEKSSIVARDVVGLGLTFDHRVADGAEAGKFLASLIKTLENPVLG